MMFPAMVSRLWSHSLHPLNVKWSKSGDIPGVPQKKPKQTKRFREVFEGSWVVASRGWSSWNIFRGDSLAEFFLE